MGLLKKEEKILLKFFNQVNLDEGELEEFIENLNEKVEDLYEKDKDEKAEEYNEVSETLQNFLESYQEFYNLLSERDLLE